METTFILTCFLCFITTGYALECYSCEGQDSNQDKCGKTVVQCRQFQDTCTSYIRWSTPPYWTPRGERVHWISKGCDTRDGCTRRAALYRMSCKRDWYNDWACVECCSGDLCNFYVTLGSSSLKYNIYVMMSTIVTIVYMYTMQR
ncbi:unnamed protein product [Owenia fusiformis]|uniref:Uncharacterized protein n=1 Tax=Owenia fusiformis TaxID=6347 RepID=A0A8S4P896_OWEFU|nr:unnamed protein product [Owenia fusiformis]